MLVSYLFVFIAACEFSTGARILGVVPTPSYSHQVIFMPIWKELAKRGHEVVVITTDPQNDPNLNITEIDIHFAYDLWINKHNVVKMAEENRYHPIRAMLRFKAATLDICSQELSHPEVKALLKNETEHFDLVIVEMISPIMFGFAARFKCPYIGVLSLDLPNVLHSVLGNPVHPVAYPDYIIGFSGKLNFWQRLASLLFNVMSYIFFVTLGGPSHISEDGLYEEHFGKDLPSVRDIKKNVSMVFINENPAFYVRPLGPAFVLIGGGVHMKPLQQLPKDLQKYLDSGKDGVIYFSLGTNVKSNMVSADLRKSMLEAFKELPYKVLWKFDLPNIPDVPENVKIVNWLPQQDVLRHPNVKVFITQGGLQSIEEALFSHVPIVGVPFIADQDANIRKAVRRGLGVYVNRNSLTKDNFKEAILEVINNPIYKQKTIEISELSKDQPMTGLEKAVWWTEYVIRHKGARHLRSPMIDLPFYQYYLLDVLGFLLGIISVLLFVTYKIISFTKNRIVNMYKSSFDRKIKKR